MNPVEPDFLLLLLRSLGLDFSEKSGGHLARALAYSQFQSSPVHQLILQDGTRIDLMSCELFMNTLSRTEHSLKLKLFV